jgi:hypothetical protein
MDGPPIRSACQPASGLTLLDVPSITIRGTAFTVRFRRTLPPRGGCRVPHQHRTPKIGCFLPVTPILPVRSRVRDNVPPSAHESPDEENGGLRLRRWRLRIDRVDACPSRVEPSASAVGPHALEDQASASAQSAPTALLHPLKAAVPLPLSRSMQLGRAGGPLPHPRRAPPFVHASERRRVQASDARPGRLAGVRVGRRPTPGNPAEAGR